MRIDRLQNIAKKKVSTLKPPLLNSHSAFVEKAWGLTSIRKDYNFLQWKFKSADPHNIAGLLVYVENEEVQGQLGVIPDKVKIDGQVHACQWGCNFKCLPEYEGSGIGALLDIASLEKTEITFGVSPTKQSEDIKRRLGFTLLEGPRVLMYPVDFYHLISLKLPPKLRFSRVAFKALFQAVYKIIFNKIQRKSISQIDVFEGDWKDIFSFLKKARAKISIPHVVHDEQFMHWRCDELPKYRSSALSLYTNLGSFVVCNVGNPYLMINEYNFVNRNEGVELLKKCFQKAKEMGARTLKVYANNSDQESLFSSLGFIPLRHRVTVYAHTNNSNINLGRKFHYDGYDGESNL